MVTFHQTVFLYLYIILCELVLLATGQTTDFQGPGYLTCPVADYDLQACATIDLDPSLCTSEALLSCNFTQVVPTFDDSLTTIILSLVCECVVAQGCPGSCSFTTGDVPVTSPLPTTSDKSNFTGVGLVICPYEEYFSTAASCRPSVLDNNLTFCGSCDPTILDQTFGYQEGDVSITFPLPCECLVMTNCPDTCNFTDVMITIAPTPAVTDEAPVFVPISTTDTPLAATPSISPPTVSPPTVDVAPSPVIRMPTPLSPIKVPTDSTNTPVSSVYDTSSFYRVRITALTIALLSLYL